MVSGGVDYPSFGYSTWPWSPPNKDQDNEAAKHFYTFWLNFSTEKDFVWDEIWDIPEAPDRRVRRCVQTLSSLFPSLPLFKSDGEGEQESTR